MNKAACCKVERIGDGRIEIECSPTGHCVTGAPAASVTSPPASTNQQANYNVAPVVVNGDTLAHFHLALTADSCFSI